MAFHVEIRRGRRWAREFNLDSARLDREVLDPWTARRAIQVGDREWDPADCTLRIIEGPELSGPELAFGRGWERAERSGRAVTRELIRAATRASARVAVLAETDSARDAIAAALGGLGIEAVDWNADRAGEGAEPAALVLAVETSDPPRSWLFEAGAAVGAMGGRAMVVRIGGAPGPPELAGLVSTSPGEDLDRALADVLDRLGVQ